MLSRFSVETSGDPNPRWGMNRIPRLLTLCLVVGLNAENLRAEPFVVGSGSSLGLDFEGDLFRFEGAGFSVQTLPNASGEFGPFFTGDAARLRCDPCRPGDEFNPSFRTDGEIFLGDGSATFGAVSHSRVSLYGTLDFDATPLAFPVSTADGFIVQTPFSFTGTIRGTSGMDQLFASSFTGSGNVLRFFDRTDLGFYVAAENRITFLFDAPATPVPEPATLLTIGSGLAAVVARKRSRLRAARRVR
jgi:hypothetical protein